MLALLRKLQLLTAALMLSMTINIGLGCALWRKSHLLPQVQFAQLISDQFEMGPANCHVLKQMSDWDYARLTIELSNQEVVEDGYSRGALALAVLIANFDFDIQRSMGTRALQKRFVKIDEGKTSYELIAGLDRSDFAQIQQFAHQERWPITAQGLHKLIQQNVSEDRSSKNRDERHLLADAFMSSNVFACFERLFPNDIPKSDLVTITQYLDWNQLAKILTSNLAPTHKVERHRAWQRRQMLIDAVNRGCKTAAYMLILCDFDYTVRHTSDSDLAQLLCLLDTYTAEAMNVALGVLKSSRENNIRALAAKKAGDFLDIPLPREDQWKWLAQAFLGNAHSGQRLWPIDLLQVDSEPVEIAAEDLEPEKPFGNERMHIVQRGDSLWKLSKKYGLSIQQLMALNDMTQDLLKIGQILQIGLI